MTAHRWDELAARTAVRLQRHAWITCLVGAGVLWAFWWWIDGDTRYEFSSRLSALIALNAFLAHVGRGGRSTFDRLAPLLASSVLLLPISRDWAILEVSGIAGWEWKKLADDPQVRRLAFLTALAVGVAPVAASWIFDLPFHRWLPQKSADRRTVAGTVATAFVLVLVLATRSEYSFPVVVAFAFHVVVWSRVPSRFVLFGALAIATLAAVFLSPSEDPWRTVGQSDDRPARHALRFGLWMGAAGLALFARRARGLTAIPADHAVFDVAATPAPVG